LDSGMVDASIQCHIKKYIHCGTFFQIIQQNFRNIDSFDEYLESEIKEKFRCKDGKNIKVSKPRYGNVRIYDTNYSGYIGLCEIYDGKTLFELISSIDIFMRRKNRYESM